MTPTGSRRRRLAACLLAAVVAAAVLIAAVQKHGSFLGAHGSSTWNLLRWGANLQQGPKI